MGNPWFWSKNGHFSNIFVLGNIGQENVFYDILEPKNSFLGYKNKKFKKSNNWHFSHILGLTHGFGAKIDIFPTLFFLNYRKQDHGCYDILEVQNAFLVYKIKKFKKSKNWHFPQGVNQCFWSKNGHFSNVFFREYRPGKCLLRYFRTKKRRSRV